LNFGNLNIYLITEAKTKKLNIWSVKNPVDPYMIFGKIKGKRNEVVTSK
jgi:hypothetical protein